MGRGRARGEEAALEKSEEWGAAAVYCSQPWWHSPGCTGSTVGVHPMHLDAPACLFLSLCPPLGEAPRGPVGIWAALGWQI